MKVSVTNGNTMCLDTYYGRRTIGARAVIGLCNNSPTQQWVLTPLSTSPWGTGS